MHTPGAKLSATGLKWIAYACMLLDHFAYAFLYYRSPACIALRTAGKMALPIFLLSFWRRAIDFHQSVRRYLMRLLMFAMISQPFYSSLRRLSVYARMEIYGIFGRRQCCCYAVSCAAFACGMEHIKPLFARCAACAALFVCAALLPLIGAGMRWPLFGAAFYMRGRSGRPALLLCGIFTVIVASLWLGALPNWALVSAIFRCVFRFFANAARRHARRRCARVKWRFYLIYPVQFILIPLLGMRLAP